MRSRENEGPINGPAPRLRLSIEPIIDVLAHEVFSQSIALLDLALELLAAAVDLSEIVIGQLAPLLLDFASFQLPSIRFQSMSLPPQSMSLPPNLIVCRAP
jgi:hypothetical protein